MKKLIVVYLASLLLAFSACSGNKAKEMYETAQLEELQKNYPHAKKLYNEIVEKYPDSEVARKASLRLKELSARQ